jgi:serine/threonine protein kinase, bacterial
VTNEGVAPSLITLSLRADAPQPEPAPLIRDAADSEEPQRVPQRRTPDADPAAPEPEPPATVPASPAPSATPAESEQP